MGSPLKSLLGVDTTSGGVLRDLHAAPRHRTTTTAVNIEATLIPDFMIEGEFATPNTIIRMRAGGEEPLLSLRKLFQFLYFFIGSFCIHG
jgi:hypothetical protein